MKKVKFLALIFVLSTIFLASCQKCDHDNEIIPKQNTEDIRLIAEYDRSPFPGQPAGGTSQYYNVYIYSNVDLGYSIVQIDYTAAAVVPNATWHNYRETFNVYIPASGKHFVDRMLLGSIIEVRINGKPVRFNQSN